MKEEGEEEPTASEVKLEAVLIFLTANKRNKATKLLCTTYRFICMSQIWPSQLCVSVASFHHYLQPPYCHMHKLIEFCQGDVNYRKILYIL